jgi:hypothetical protein
MTTLCVVYATSTWKIFVFYCMIRPSYSYCILLSVLRVTGVTGVFVVYDLSDRTCLIQITRLRRWTCECVKITNRYVSTVSDGNRTKGLVIQIPRDANTVNPPRVRANPKPQAKRSKRSKKLASSIQNFDDGIYGTPEAGGSDKAALHSVAYRWRRRHLYRP